MKNLTFSLNSKLKNVFSPDNGSGMDRGHIGFGSAFSARFLVALLLLFSLGIGSAWGGEETFSPSSSIWSTTGEAQSYTHSGSGITLATSSGCYNSSNTDLRVYKDYTFTVSISSGNITAISMTGVSGNPISGYSLTSGGGTFTTDGYNGSWSGTSSEIVFTASTKQVRMKSITVTYASACGGTKLGTPVVTATPSSGKVVLTWPDVTNASSYQLKWNGGDWTAASSGVQKTGLTDGTTYTYQVKAIGNGSSYCDGDASASASVVPGTYYTVTWTSNGITHATSSVRSGTKPTFPSTPTSCDTGEGASTTFYGWTTSTWDGKIDDISAKTIYTSAGDMPNISGAVEYHAVFAKGAAANTYVKGTSSQLAAGQTILIVNHASSVAFSTGGSASGWTAVSVSPSDNKITTTNSAILFTLEAGTNGFYLKQGSSYLNVWVSQGGTHYIYYDGDTDDWTISGSGPYVLRSTNKSDYRMQYNGSVFTVGTGSSGNAYEMDFYIPATPSKFLTTCVTCDEPTALTKGSINASSQTVSWTAPSSAPAGGYYVAYSTATSSDPGNDVYSTSGNYTVMAISAGTTTANIPCNSAGTYNWWVRSKCSSSDNTSCSGWVKGTAFTMKTIYLNTNYDWNAGNARFAVHYWNDDTPTPKSGWSKLMTEQTDCYGGIYKVVIPDGYNNINFGRFSTAQTTDPTDWTNRWNQTANLTIPTSPAKDYFTLSSKTGDYDYNGSWSNYTQSFQIDFNLNKGGASFTTYPATAPDARCVATGSTTSAPTNPVALGKEITGWYKESGKTNEWVFASQTVSEDQTLFAKWENVANKTIYLDASASLSGGNRWDQNGATDLVMFAHAYINNTGDPGLYYDVKMTAVSTCQPHVYTCDIPGTATHVSFARCANGTTELPASWTNPPVYNQISGKTVEEGKDLYTITDWGAATLEDSPFSPTTYSMSFATGSTTYTGGNAISGSKDSEDKACDVDYTLPGSAVFSTTGYTQTSWATEDGGSKAYDFGDDYKDNADQAFYPVWTINSHTLTWNWGGGSTSSDSYTAGGTVNYGATITYPANNTMSKTGYDFSSWSTDATTMPDNDLTITASWTIHTHKVSVASVSNATITATPAGGSAIAEGSNNGSVSYGTIVTLNWPTPDTHYSSITWDVYKDGDSSTKVAVSGSGNGATFTLPDYDVVVSATAVEDAYKTVCFKNNGVGITGYTAQKVYVGSRPTAPTLTDGYGTGDACDETSDKHYGWTQETWNSTIANKSTIDARTGSEAVYAKSANLPTVTAGDPSTIYYHAVWAEGTAAPTINTTLIAKWDKQEIEASTSIKAKDASGNTLNSVLMSSNKSFSSSGTYTYNNGSVGGAATITISGLSFSSYTKGSISFYTRQSNTGTWQIQTSSDGSAYSDATEIGSPGSYDQPIIYANIPNTTTHIKLLFSGVSNSLNFGTVRIYGVTTSPTYDFTELTSSNTSGWSGSDWEGYYLITGNSSTKALRSDGIDGYSFTSVTASSNKITTGDVGLIFKATYSSGDGYVIQGVASGDYINTNKASKNYQFMTTSQVYLSSISYNDILLSTGNYLQWNSSSSLFGVYSSMTSPTLYKIMASFSTFRTTCCTTYDITLDGGGTISGAGTFSAGVDAACATETITLTKDICDGYTVGDWTVHKTGDESTTVTVTSNQFTMPAYDVTVKLSTTIKTSHFIDKLHRTEGYTDDGYAVSGCDQTVPTLSDASAPGVGETGCEEMHYKFVGWVPEANIASDGTLTGSPTILEGGTTDWDATGTDYVAVWAKIK